MTKVRAEVLEEIKAALAVYEEEVRSSRLAPATKTTYLRHASTFVRWLDVDFTPGANL